jgi:hypothetical protein
VRVKILKTNTGGHCRGTICHVRASNLKKLRQLASESGKQQLFGKKNLLHAPKKRNGSNKTCSASSHNHTASTDTPRRHSLAKMAWGVGDCEPRFQGKSPPVIPAQTFPPKSWRILTVPHSKSCVHPMYLRDPGALEKWTTGQLSLHGSPTSDTLITPGPEARDEARPR